MDLDRGLVLVVGIGGITCSFKSTLANNVMRVVNDEYKDAAVRVVHQDDYYLPPDQVPRIPELDHYDFECPESVAFDKMTQDVRELINRYSHRPSASGVISPVGDKKAVIIVEGIMIFHHKPLLDLFDQRYCTFGSYDECERVRSARVDYVPADVPGYFDGYIWPAAVRYEQEARALAKEMSFRFLPMNDMDKNFVAIALGVRKWLDRDWLLLTNGELVVQQAVRFVTEPSDGAVAVFCGVTRDSFQGKAVIHLEYEAYEDMAYLEMRKLCTLLRSKWKEIDRVVLHHRLGIVPITETSVLIAISSPHRKEAQEACAFAIDTLKANVPIWKKEIYSDGSGAWKENSECCSHRQP